MDGVILVVLDAPLVGELTLVMVLVSTFFESAVKDTDTEADEPPALFAQVSV